MNKYLDHAPKRLAAYVVRRPGFRFVECGRHVHIGALLADGALQAGLNYRTVVFPRVSRLEHLFPMARTMTGLVSTLFQRGAAELLDWKHQEKLNRFELLVEFFRDRADSVADVAVCLSSDQSMSQLLALRGIGAKTGDYLFRLAGGAEVAVDRHVIRFVQDAGIPHESYEATKRIVNSTADLLGVSRGCFDASIWHFMSAQAQKARARVDGCQGLKKPGSE